jgi:hypothetical protein
MLQARSVTDTNRAFRALRRHRSAALARLALTNPEAVLNPKLAILFLPAAIALAAPAIAGPQPIQVGYWEAQTDWLGLKSGVDRWCVKPKDVSKFLSGPSNHIYHCTYPVSTAANGAIHFQGACVDKKGQEIKLRGDGAYTPTTVRMTASGSTKLLGIDVTGDASVNARLISPTCPPDAKAFT